MARGGRRSGAPGQRYQNRTDLQSGTRKLPNVVATGQPYGEAGQQQQALAAVPAASGDLSDQTAPDFSQASQSAQDFNPPPVVPLGAPTQQPDQHVMTPPSAPMPGASDPLLNGVALLNSLGSTASPEVKALRNVVSAAQANAAAP